MSPGSQPQESPESRLIGAGFSPYALGWLSPGGLEILSLEQALAQLPNPEPESVTEEPEESAHSRVIVAGYARLPMGWLAPRGRRVVSLEEALVLVAILLGDDRGLRGLAGMADRSRAGP